MSSPRQPPYSEGRRIVICDYNALLVSVTGLLRMSGYCVFQAYDAHAVEELCAKLPDIELVVLNTFGTGINTGDLVRHVRATTPGLPVLHIGTSTPEGLPSNVPTLPETFSPDTLLSTVSALMDDATQRPRPA